MRTTKTTALASLRSRRWIACESSATKRPLKDHITARLLPKARRRRRETSGARSSGNPFSRSTWGPVFSRFEQDERGERDIWLSGVCELVVVFRGEERGGRERKGCDCCRCRCWCLSNHSAPSYTKDFNYRLLWGARESRICTVVLDCLRKFLKKKTGLFDCEGLSEICRFMQYFVIIVSNQIAIYFI